MTDDRIAETLPPTDHCDGSPSGVHRIDYAACSRSSWRPVCAWCGWKGDVIGGDDV